MICSVDDAFILIHRWRHRFDIPDRSLRLTKVIVDVGPSITITSLTNIIAFGVGFFTPTPQMSLFCLATSVALLIDYIATYTILAPVVYLCSTTEDYQMGLSTKPSKNDFIGKYSRLLCSMNGRLICGVFLISAYSFSAVGVYSMKSTFDPAKAFPSDSPLVKSLKHIRPVFDTYFPVRVYVNHPPNISDDKQKQILIAFDDACERANFYQMVSELEHVEGAYDSVKNNFTLIFLKDYEKFDKKVTGMTQSLFLAPDMEYKPSLHNLQFWLDRIGNPPTIKYVKGNQTDAGEAKDTVDGRNCHIIGQVTGMTQSLFLAPDIEYKPSLHNLQFWLDRIGNPPTIKYVKGNQTE
ncbi:hypothetical protein DICVIV_06137 [Dictyocaulus viviparus]|uniref:SSD domain-containing protein n=1 Tax=Dictyocaulus viviparus TaxID=29172 RepID=A0A0D8XVJ1_DICVI|nr:hypothetical protein DICVIV_06137 [Dictyocaulus viviparus]